MNTKSTTREVYNIANESWNKLYPWLKQNGLEGFDPYMIRDMPFYYWLSSWPQFLPLKLIRFPIIRFIEFCPSLWINLLHIKPKAISKGVGLLASSYLTLYKATNNKLYLDDANYCLDWLLNNSVKGYTGISWGVPFSYKSVKLIPEGTPTSVATVHVGHAFWERYQILQHKEDLDVCCSICEFLVNELYCHEISTDQVSFGYTVIDSSHVLNASLLTSEFLIRIGDICNNNKWKTLGERGVNYILQNQQKDGSFCYSGQEDEGYRHISSRSLKKIDGYHTGFVLRTLNEANNIINSTEVDLQVKKGLDFYITNFIDFDKGIPYTHLNIHRKSINIHGCAEALLILSNFRMSDDNIDKILLKVLKWTVKYMQDPTGYFYFEKTPIITKKIAYIRWGEAWMARALSDIINRFGQISKNEENDIL